MASRTCFAPQAVTSVAWGARAQYLSSVSRAPARWRQPGAAQQRPASRRQQCRRLRAEQQPGGTQPAEDSEGDDQQPGTGGSQPDALMDYLLEAADLNRLQTALNTAIASDNFELAARLRDILRLLTGADGTQPADWAGLDIVGWLADRAESLGFNFPTEVQKRSTPIILDGDDCIIQSETGSGKTLALLMPLLSLLTYPPQLYSDDLKGPQAVIVVPTRELGVQLVMLVYRLFGGSVNQGVPGLGGNMFDFHGPRGLKVKGLLLESEVTLAKKEYYLKGAHVVVGTPELLAQALSGPDAVEVVQHAVALAVDEVDACFQAHPQEMELIMQAACQRGTQPQQQQQEEEDVQQQPQQPPPQRQQQDGEEGQRQFTKGQQELLAALLQQQQERKPVVVLVGATLDEPLIQHVVQQGWVRDPVTVRVGGRMRIPSGLQHRCIVVDEAARVAAMCRQIRVDLKKQSEDEAPARVMVFAGSEDQARQLSDPLRTVLWGDHKISVLLPEGSEPIKALHSFRDNKTTLLLATPAAARGLDLPAVSHVYNVDLPATATEYLHRAGRAGRIGSSVQGVITTLVTEEELPQLQAMAAELSIEISQLAPPPSELPAAAEGEEGMEAARRGLEDLFNLF